MSVEKLQQKIRKLKNPTVIDFTVPLKRIPEFLMGEEGTLVAAYGRFCHEALNALTGLVPAVRFSYGYFSLLGPEGIELFHHILSKASSLGFFVMVDSYEFYTREVSEIASARYDQLPLNALILSEYSGADALTPYLDLVKNREKSLFVHIRSGNKSAAQLQDLMTGSRLVHMAAADIVKRTGEGFVGKSGYAQIAGVAAANAPDSIRMLREKYPKMFLLVDGYDYANANAKYCSYAFDRLGHGAAVCASSSVLCAWENAQSDGRDFATHIVNAAERMRKNITKYVTVL